MAANQSRRRADPNSSIEGSVNRDSTEAFCYRPLAEGVDCTRLVEIQPAGDDNDSLIVCNVVQVEFGDRPTYKALSYRWGDETDKRTILVNGAGFQVGRNLWDALHCLRQKGGGERYWIDAICINQDDIAERNRQVRNMRHIYFRAHTVIIWLGSAYAAYQIGIPRLQQYVRSHAFARDEPTGRKSAEGTASISTPSENDDAISRMLKELCDDQYWSRLWIVQEVTLAQRLQVSFGNLDMTWKHFISLVTLSHGPADGPLRLDRHLNERYTESYKLVRLLRDHKDAACKEPKDKIYGLVGLAADAPGFPMDYNKSLFEIWEDTMEFMNRQGLMNESEIVDLGRLVKFLLMRHETIPLHQTLRPYESEVNSSTIIENLNSPKVFELQSYVLGNVQWIGPSAGDIVKNLESVNQWELKVQANFNSGLGSAHQESHMLLRSILNTDNTALATRCFNHTSTVRWAISSDNPWSVICKYQQITNRSKQSIHTSLRTDSNSSDPTDSNDPYLYQLLRGEGQLSYLMGISSTQLELGDLMVWVHGINKIAILRVIEVRESSRGYIHMKLQMNGTGLVSEDVAGLTPDPTRRFSGFSEHDLMQVYIDARTLFVLLEGE
ncbi:heterokaryon incompatibility protein-domain-containing protein [Xylariomycetidae sp. FL2044]|nr:heterokaryon incompatibility protein-domain-containing protein [Xylariomycetidae sp. FL2044]